jgi:hypothetical protein
VKINRRKLRAKLGSRTVRRQGTKSGKHPKPSPKVLLRELVQEEARLREAK